MAFQKYNDDTDQLLLQLFNKRTKMTPPIELQGIEISRSIDCKTVGGEPSDPSNPRPIIARFASRRVKGVVMPEQKKLRRRRTAEWGADLEPTNDETNAGGTDGEENEDESSDDVRRIFLNPVYISVDLTRRWARLAKITSDLRRQGKIWRIMVKDQRNAIHKIKKESGFPF